MSLQYTHKPDYFFFAQLLVRHLESYVKKHPDAQNAIFDLRDIYELFRQDFDLCVFYRCLFPASWGDCYDCTLSVGNPDGNFDGNAS